MLFTPCLWAGIWEMGSYKASGSVVVSTINARKESWETPGAESRKKRKSKFGKSVQNSPVKSVVMINRVKERELRSRILQDPGLVNKARTLLFLIPRAEASLAFFVNLHSWP